jgi:hypothetical protein
MFIVIALGLSSRAYPHLWPHFWANYAGDTLWALMAFLLIGFMFPFLSTLKVAAIALLFSLFIELSQLYQATWINELRQYRIIALVIGRGFLWSDLVCYSMGVAMGAMGEMLWIQYRINKRG